MMTEWAQRQVRDEGGGVAVIVALLLVVFVGFSAVAIDLGSGWSAKRSLVSDLDAATLAGAKQIRTEVQCNAQVGSIVTETIDVAAMNGTVISQDDVEVECEDGIVRASGEKEATTAFSGAMGRSELHAGGRSASVNIDAALGHLMPFTLCEELVFDPDDEDDEGTPLAELVGQTIDVPFADGESLCEGNPGNWGWWGAGGTGTCNNEDDTLNWFVCAGYPGTVLPEGDSEPPKCTGPGSGDIPGWCDGRTGAVPNVLEAINDMWGGCPESERCQELTLLVHDDVDGGTGNNAEFRPSALLRAEFESVTAQGNNSEARLKIIEYLTREDVEDLGGEVAFQTRSRVCDGDPMPDDEPCFRDLD